MPKTRDGSGEPPTDQSTDRLSVLSFNLRYAADPPADPADDWQLRAPLVRTLLSRLRPTVVGFQEPLLHQLSTIRAGLPDYDAVGYGRQGGGRGEHNPIWYDPARVRLLDWDQQWLSDTPTVTGSVAWGADLPRILVRADFVQVATGRRFTMINTHLDHQSAEAQRRGAEQIAAVVAEIDGPVVVTGDFNTAAGRSEPWGVLVAAGLVDSWTTAERRESADVATWHGYADPTPGGDRIDWIMTSPGIEVVTAAIETWTEDGHWPSDHYPIRAELRLPDASGPGA